MIHVPTILFREWCFSEVPVLALLVVLVVPTDEAEIGRLERREIDTLFPKWDGRN